MFGATAFSKKFAAVTSGVPPSAYPGRVATNADLTVGVNRLQTSLAMALDAVSTMMTVTDASGIVLDTQLSIDSEIVLATSISGNQVTVTRGFDGTTPASHLSGAAVLGNINAWHHNSLVAEIEAIETALGPNLSHVAAFPMAVATAYTFTPQSPGGSLTVGNNQITLSPVPSGVNGTDKNHYLYVSGGTGTAEAVLITGGSAVEGAASGALIIQCANTHSGAWTIQTATGGIQEAIVAAGPLAAVYMPSGSYTLHAPIYDGSGVSLVGTGENTTLIPDQSVVNPVLVESPNNSGYGSQANLDSFSIQYASQPASGSALILHWMADVRVTNVRIYGAYNGLQLSGVVRLQAANITIIARNYALWLYGTSTDISNGLTNAGQITNLRILNATVGVEIDSPTAGFHINGIYAECDPVNYPMTTGINFNSAGPGAINEFIVTGGFLDGVTQNAILTNPTTPISTNGTIITNLRIFGYGASSYGVSLFNVSQFKVMNNYILVQNTGVRLSATSGCQITGNTILAEAAAMTGVTLNSACTDNMIQNNLIGGSNLGGGTGVIATYGLAGDATAHARNTISGNRLYGSTAPISWSGTGTGNTITGNPGVDSVWPSVASQATVTLPPAPFATNFVLTGNVAVTAVAGWSSLSDGTQGTFIATDPAPGAWTAGATIGNTFTPVTNKPVRWTVYQGKLYLS